MVGSILLRMGRHPGGAWSYPVRRRLTTSVVKLPPTFFFFHNSHWAKLTEKVVNADKLSSLHTANIERHASSHRDTVFTPRQLVKLYAQLSKSQLTVLNVLTAMSTVALSPLPATLPTLLSTAIGTALCSASANALNQLQEVPFDAQMARTRMRPLVRRAVTPLHATGFAFITGLGGSVVLWTLVNPTTAILGATNIALYAGLYTWMKRKNIINTWVGAIVGAVPPLMGWTACGGQLFPSASCPVQFFLPPFLSLTSSPLNLTMINNPLAPMALFMLLFSWQFPHFNSLSHRVRGSYAQAGYFMLSALSPSRNALVALRHAMILMPVCSILVPLSGLTTWTFALTTLIPNAFCIRAAWKFWRHRDEKNARAVFQHSLWYLPVILGLMMVHKQGMDWLEWIGFEKNDPEAEETQD
jgi:protoheme IX farnesyltransferase